MSRLESYLSYAVLGKSSFSEARAAMRVDSVVRLRVKSRGKPRRGPMRDPKYRQFLKDYGYCPACSPWAWAEYGAVAVQMDRYIRPDVNWYILVREPGYNNCDPAHTENNGTSSKGPDSSCAPLCRRHHVEYDAGRKAFEKKYKLSMGRVAKAWYQLYSKSRKGSK